MTARFFERGALGVVTNKEVKGTKNKNRRNRKKNVIMF